MEEKEIYTTKDTPIAVNLVATGKYKIDGEKVGKEIWFNFPKEAEVDVAKYLMAKQKISEFIFSLLKEK